VLKSELFPAGANLALRGMTLASKFALLIVLGRFFSLEDLGVYGLMVASVAIAIFVVGAEYKYFTLRALVARQASFQTAILRDQAVFYGVIGAILLPPLILVFWTGTWSPVPRAVLLWFLLLTVVELAAQEAGNALLALGRPLAANLVLFIRSAAWVYPVIALVIAVPATRDIASVFLAWLVGALASLAVTAWCMRGMGWRSAVRQPVHWAGIRSGLRIAAPFIVTTGASLGLLFFDRYIIEIFHGLGPVGIYTFFAGIATALHTLINTSVSLIRVPRLVKAHQDADEPRFRGELGVMVRLTVIGVLLLAPVITIGMLPILALVDKPTYGANFNVFGLLLGAAAIRCLADPPLYALYARHRDMQLLAINVFGFLVSACANLVLVPQFGLLGASVGATLGGLALLVSASVTAARSPGLSRTSPAADIPAPPRFSSGE
jgi:O-antigen/teichoic acid export membrane protein